MDKASAPTNINFIKQEYFKLYIDNNANNPEYIIEISLLSDKLNIKALKNILNDITFYESSYNYDSFIKIDEYFKFCKEINKIYDFIIQLKKTNSISLIKENEKIFLNLSIIQPIQNIIKIPLDEKILDNNIINTMKLLLKEKNSEIQKLKDEIQYIEDKYKNRLIRRDIKGYSYNFTFIENEIEKQLKKNVIKYELLYKAKKDGDKSENFHSKCDNKENTLTIIKSTNGKTFGAFTTQLWNSINNFKTDKFAFAFSLDNQKIYNILENRTNFAIYAHNDYGPCFGQGTDFGIYSGCLTRSDNWCCNKNTYNFNNENMNGDVYFQTLDYEVYSVIFD